MKITLLEDGRDRKGRIYNFNDLQFPTDCFVGYNPDRKFGWGKLSDVSHEITDIRIEGNSLVGTVRILKTNSGKQLESLINTGEKFRFSLVFDQKTKQVSQAHLKYVSVEPED